MSFTRTETERELLEFKNGIEAMKEKFIEKHCLKYNTYSEMQKALKSMEFWLKQHENKGYIEGLFHTYIFFLMDEIEKEMNNRNIRGTK